MIPVLYGKSEVNFESLGLGFLPDVISMEITEERNGEFYLEAAFPADGKNVEYLAIDRVILARPAQGESPQPFRIRKMEKPEGSDTVQILAHHISYQLSETMVITYGENSTIPTYSSAKDAMDFLFSHAKPDLSSVFQRQSNIVSTKAFGIKGEPVSVRAALSGVEGSIVDVFGGELKFDKWTVKLLSSRGSSASKIIRYGLNLASLSYDVDVSGLITAYIGYFRLEEGPAIVGNMVYASNYSDFAYPRVETIDFTEQLAGDYLPTTAQITTATEAYVAGQPTHNLMTSITVEAVPDDLQNVHLCDTVTVVHPGFNLQQQAKIVKTVYDPIRERYISLTIGEIRKDITGTIAALIGVRK